MFRSSHPSFFRVALPVLSGALLLAPSALAAPYFTPTEEVTEVMMEALGQTLLNTTSTYGYGSLDSFSMYTYVDVAGGNFSYGTMPGATLNGAPLNISVSGHGDTMSRTYNWSSMINVGTQTSIEFGNLAITTPVLRDSPDANESGDSDCTIDGHSGTRGPITWTGSGNNTVSHAHFRWDDAMGHHDVPVSDTYLGNGQWKWVIGAAAGGANGMNAGIDNTGFSDPLSGVGSVQVNLGSSVTPTPGAAALAAMAGLTVVSRRRR